jgi:shikimate kinase
VHFERIVQGKAANKTPFMKYTQKAFDEAIATGTIKIAFIGMSNVGKTKVSKSLAKAGAVHRFEVDEEIGRQLHIASITSLADWMGFPYEEKYAAAEEAYLALEDAATLQAMRELKAPCALDTTGSVVYLPEKTLRALKQEWLVVHIAVVPSDVEELYKNYIAMPKPVVWSGMYSENAGESPEAALKRSYKALLKNRVERYRALADVSIPRFELYKAKSPAAVYAAIRKRLSA